MRTTSLAFISGLWREQPRVWLNTASTTTTSSFWSTTGPSPPPHSSAATTTHRSRARMLRQFSFQAPDPPGTMATPVFPDVDLASQWSNIQSNLRNSDPNAVFVVTGASRGIGLQFCKTLLTRTKGTIIACCRSPESATGLNSFIGSVSDRSRIQILQLDLEDQKSMEDAANHIQQQFTRVDLLLHVAGILGDAKTTPGPERALSKLNRGWFEKTLAINVVGPVMLSKELAPLLMQSRSRQRNHDSTGSRPVAVVASLSARVGSITDNSLGGWYSYRISKAALNQATRTMALEMKRSGVWCVSLHPGTTDTDLSRPFQSNVQQGRLFPVGFTVNQLMNVIDSLTEHHSGGFYDWAGKAICF